MARLDRGALAHFLQTFHHDAFAGFQPLLDHPVAAKSWTYRDSTLGNLIRIIHHPDKISALQLQDRSLRNKERASALLHFDPQPRVLAWPEDIARIWENRTDPNGARFWIHFPISRQEAPFVWMHFAVSADQFADRFTLVEGFGEHCRDAISRREVLFFAKREDNLDRIYR